MAAYSDDVLAVALQVCEAHAAGSKAWTMGSPAQTFDLVTGGWCGRFVRQVYEVAQHLPAGAFQFAAPSAACCEYRLMQAGLKVMDPNPGDILCLNGSVPSHLLNNIDWQRANRNFGHIAIHLSDESFAENTSSGRGPGTVVSRYSEIAGRTRTYYRVLPALPSPQGTLIKIIEHSTGNIIEEHMMVPNGNHIADQGKLYVE